MNPSPIEPVFVSNENYPDDSAASCTVSKDAEGAAVLCQLSKSDSTSSLRSRYSDCALIEIIHLHDCLRGAIRNLAADVRRLQNSAVSLSNLVPSKNKTEVSPSLSEMARKVAARFQVIWSVFTSHSSAEDEFIWPALRNKLGSVGEGGCCGSSSTAASNCLAPSKSTNDTGSDLEEDEYKEDHADEERMFLEADVELRRLRHAVQAADVSRGSLLSIISSLLHCTEALASHLLVHLDKEETQCMPLIAKHLSPREITDLVGNIMGKRSGEVIKQILCMAAQNLPGEERRDMVRYMREAMVGTYFERWMVMGGYGKDLDEMDANNNRGEKRLREEPETQNKPHSIPMEKDDNIGKIKLSPIPLCSPCKTSPLSKTPRTNYQQHPTSTLPMTAQHPSSSSCKEGSATASNDLDSSNTSTSSVHTILCGMTDPCLCMSPSCPRPPRNDQPVDSALLQKLIRAVAADPRMDLCKKNVLIQDLRERVWRSNGQLRKNKSFGQGSSGKDTDEVASEGVCRRSTPPSSYYLKNARGVTELVWSSESGTFPPPSVPLFSASELAPSFNDGATGAVLGCPHYSRACKLRHPSSGRLYTCRLCCEQVRFSKQHVRDLPTKARDCPLDRYKVTEIFCMVCGALQPAGRGCVNTRCESHHSSDHPTSSQLTQSLKPFAKYTCRICNLYDDGKHKSIYHCPFCNVCRAGKGLGIDFRHCMRCNACVSLTAKEPHVCIPQTLQGHCSICHETLFESTQPLKGLKCGHVMHLSCFRRYVSGQAYTCPLCKKSVEDMRERFEMLDHAIRMQPMPRDYANMKSTVYCQDCGKSGVTTYHFIGCKCKHCGSFNTREVRRSS